MAKKKEKVGAPGRKAAAHQPIHIWNVETFDTIAKCGTIIEKQVSALSLFSNIEEDEERISRVDCIKCLQKYSNQKSLNPVNRKIAKKTLNKLTFDKDFKKVLE